MTGKPRRPGKAASQRPPEHPLSQPNRPNARRAPIDAPPVQRIARRSDGQNDDRAAIGWIKTTIECLKQLKWPKWSVGYHLVSPPFQIKPSLSPASRPHQRLPPLTCSLLPSPLFLLPSSFCPLPSPSFLLFCGCSLRSALRGCSVRPLCAAARPRLLGGRGATPCPRWGGGAAPKGGERRASPPAPLPASSPLPAPPSPATLL